MCYSVYMKKNDCFGIKVSLIRDSMINKFLQIPWTRNAFQVHTADYVSTMLSNLCIIVFTNHMMTSSNGNILRATGHLCGEFTGLRWIPLTKASGTGDSNHKGQWRGALMFSLICAWTNGWVNNRKAGDWRHTRAHYEVIVMQALADDNFHYDDRDKTVTISCCHHRTRYMSP